jgi:hypothetical protein
LNRAILVAAAFVTVASLAGCSVVDNVPASSQLPPRIDLFTISPSAITSGQSALLTWSVSDNKSTVSIAPGVGMVPAAGSVPVSPAQQQEYTITAANQFGKVTSALIVNVIEDNAQKPQSLPLIYSFKARPEHGPAGAMFELSWDIEDADSISIQWGDKNALNFTRNADSMVQQPVVTTTYMLVAKNRHGVRAANLTVAIDRDSPGAATSDPGASCG